MQGTTQPCWHRRNNSNHTKRMQKMCIRLAQRCAEADDFAQHKARCCKGIEQPALLSGHCKFSYTAPKMHNEKQQGSVFIRFQDFWCFVQVLFVFFVGLCSFLSRCVLLTICIFVIYCSTFQRFVFGNKMHGGCNELVCGLCSTAIEGKSNKQTASSWVRAKPLWKGIECKVQQHGSKLSLVCVFVCC